MSKFKRLIVGLILPAILSSLFVVAPGVAAVTTDSFSDVDFGDDAYAPVDYLRQAGVVVGYEDGSYGPDLPINRAEFLKIVMEVSDHEVAGENCFPDVKADWFAGYVCAAKQLGLVDGYPVGMFHPEREINFAEAAKIVANTLNIELGDQSDEWFEPYVLGLETESAIPNTFTSFDHLITRAEMAEIIWRIDADAHYRLSNTFENLQKGETVPERESALEAFQSCEALETYLNESQSGGYEGGYLLEESLAPSPTADSAELSTGAAKTTADLAPSESGNYSETNVQVAGVDEADIVKTDGEYIYLVKNDTVRVVKAYPPSGMEEVDMVEFDDPDFYPQEMYVDGDKLVVLGDSYSYGGVYPVDYVYKETEVIYPSSSSLAKVYVFDISDPKNMREFRSLGFEGNYQDSRKVDDMVYVVLNQYKYAYYNPFEDVAGEESPVPLFYDSAGDQVKPVVSCGDVLYWPGVVENQYVIVAGIPVDDADGEVAREAVLGSSGEIYASRDNLYVAENRYPYYIWNDNGRDDKEKTIIHKFALGREEISYKGKGEVPGTILNQFSMDEYEGNFRIATTIGDVWNTENPSTNNVYVLNANLQRVGELEGLAPGERIYSSRFAGNRSYLVTFKKIDPFFVIDLSDATNPKVLGKLKIPGFSDYLHIWDDNHVIGFGLDTAEPTEEELGDRNFAWYQGIKLAMFDVTDPENPVELYREIIGDRGTESPLNYDHKALLIDKNKGIMAFPVLLAEIPQEVKDDPDASKSTYGDYVFQGAYVYDVSVANGFDLQGRISQYEENEVSDLSGWYFWGPRDIERILYIGDYFYTVSQAIVQANRMSDLAEINEVELDGEDPVLYPPTETIIF